MLSLTRKSFSDETTKKVHWVKQMFNDWKEFRCNSAHLESVDCDIDHPELLSKEVLSKAVCKFITEVKKLDGGDFPPRTLYDIVICLQFWMEHNGFNWKLISDSEFQDVKFTLDNMMKQRAAKGIGNEVKQAEVLTFTDKDFLWCQGLLGTHSPQVLLNTVVFLLSLHCSLRAGKEHRILRSIPFCSQFQFLYDCNGKLFLRYIEDVGLKMNKGGLKHRSVECKQVDVYCTSNIECCPVRIFQEYLGKLPKNRNCPSLYLQPRKKFNARSWYFDKQVGVNTLHNVVKNVCKEGSLPGYYTNHSLRASSATRMYRNGVEGQVIQEITGHRSLAVRSYKRTSNVQCQRASQAIAGAM